MAFQHILFINSFDSDVDQSRLEGLGAVVDISRHLGVWCGDVMFASKIVNKIIAVHSSMKSVTRRQHEIYLIFTITG